VQELDTTFFVVFWAALFSMRVFPPK